ncbi:pyrroline-5-carboxylate reductase [Pyrodictium occultum]|uniref:pyrroline-5-carboxylate reductase n=1 Tax=Pyrodictium occultum TaxID=2309 RepID=UPI0014432201|nr:pyrroline-5-carboxylate reductase [Pyrodictium occultum]
MAGSHPVHAGCRFRLSDLTVAVLGAGKIGSIMASSFSSCGMHVIATARSRERIERLRMQGFEATSDNAYAVRKASAVFIAVKPYQYPALARQIEGHVAGKPVVSVMAGIPLRLLRKTLPGAEVYRAMPNLNAAVKRSATGLVAPPGAQYKELVKSILSCMGRVYELPEQLIDAWTAVAGSGPAIIAEFIDSMILAALAVGIPRDLAYDAVLESIIGTAEYLRARPVHPAQLRDEVTTPGGTTITALKIIEGKGMKSALIDAVEKATARAARLAREIEAMLEETAGDPQGGGGQP